MSFIGIITGQKNSVYAKNMIEKNLKNKNVTVIVINDKNIENVRNIKFETIIMTEEIKKEEYLKKILRNTKYLIINADMRYNVSILKDIEIVAISYGFNHKSTVTISSIEEDNILVCIQRNMLDINGHLIESQELSIKTESKDKNFKIDTTMGLIIAILIYGQRNIIIF